MSETQTTQLTKKDFVSDQAVRWCPGCGDYAILAQAQKQMPTFGRKKEDIVFVSGIGCSSRFPYYMDTYGFHSIHGRAPAVATPVANRVSRRFNALLGAGCSWLRICSRPSSCGLMAGAGSSCNSANSWPMAFCSCALSSAKSNSLSHCLSCSWSPELSAWSGVTRMGYHCYYRQKASADSVRRCSSKSCCLLYLAAALQNLPDGD